MVTTFPAAIDNSSSLPTVFDNITGLHAVTINILRDTAIAIEATLGTKPQSVYTTVRARLDAMEALIQSSIIGEISFSGDISGTTTHQTVIGLQTKPISPVAPVAGQPLIFDGVQYSPSTNFFSQNLITTGSIIAGPVLSTSAETGLLTTDGKFIINGIMPTIISNTGQAIIYYDSTLNKLRVSENGGAYVNLLTVDAITWSQDLAGSTVSNQIVVGLTGAGGFTEIRSTSAKLIWDGSTTSPTITQNPGSGAGGNLFITGQSAGGSNNNGGNLILGSGFHSGSGNDGYVALWDGYVEIAQTTSTQLNALAYGVGGISGSVPTITTGTGAPSSTPTNGSIYLRQDGYYFTGLYIYEQNSWFPIGDYKPTAVTGNYNVLGTDDIIAVGTLSGSITISLFATPISGQSITIKDANGSASAHNIVVSGNGTNIDGSASITLDQNYASITLVYTNPNWSVL